MQRLGCQYSECQGTFWCSRCGTLKVDGQNGTVVAPALVRSCRDFFHNMGPVYWADLYGRLNNLGILESINVPEDRRTPP